MIETIKKIIFEFHESKIPSDLIERDIDIESFINIKLAKIIIGPRRAGKTYFLYQIMKKMNLHITDYIYINFEDDRLIDFTYKNFDDIFEAYYQIYPNKKPVFFLDEIHNIDRWEYFVRRLVDKKYNVFLTGSNAHLLSKEYATKLGGRYLEILVMPLSFKEFLKFKNFRLEKNYIYSKDRFNILKYFDEYLKFGGFPEVVLSNKKKDILQQYLDSIVYRDIISRYSINDDRLLTLILKKIAENVTNPYSFNSIVKKLKSINFSTNVKTISKYYYYMNQVFLILHSSIKKESFIKKQQERKSYFIDNGLLNLFYINENKDKLLENVVAVALFIKSKNLYYYRNALEIDFVDPVIQVILELNDNNREREIKALLKYLEKTNTKEAYILTYNQRENIKIKNKIIKVIPVWQYLLEN